MCCYFLIHIIFFMPMKSETDKILSEPVQYLKSVGPKRAEAFRKIGIVTVKDLLFYFPSRHLDRTTTLNSAKAHTYLINGFAGELTIIAKVADTEKLRFGKKELFKVQMRELDRFF